MSVSNHAEYTKTLERLHAWARSSGLHEADALVLDLAELRTAALAYIRAVDDLATALNDTPAERAKRLTQIQIGLYEELADHLAQLREPLARVTDRAYKVGAFARDTGR